MSSTESSGAPAEATTTTPAPEAAFPTFGSTRGSGLARGKRPAAAPAATAAATSDYKPTAIEVVSAPREYQNPFAPAETPAAVAPEPVVVVPAPVAIEPVVVAPVGAPDNYVAPSLEVAPAPAPSVEAQNEEPAGLNILEPMKPKAVPAQTWESEGFRPAREQRQERPRREESRREEPRREERAEPAAAEPVDISTIPAKFLYVRPGYNYVPTPTNYGGAPRERAPRNENASASASVAPRTDAPKRPAPSASAAQKPASSGGFIGWLKSLFGGAPETPAAPQARSSEHRSDGNRPQGQHREGGQGRGGDGQRRRHRGGRGRGQGGGGGQHRSEGSQQGGV